MTRALIIVDVQPTFCEGGELPVEGGNEVALNIAAYVRQRAGDYDVIATTQDWHIDPGEHFSDTPDFVDSWPPHGVAGSPNAALHPLVSDLPDITFKKGQYEAAYSGFEGVTADGRGLRAVLHAHGVDAVDVVGLAQSHCVKATAIDAAEIGFKTRVFTDLTAPVSAELGEVAATEMLAAGVELEEVFS